ncbi:MAG: hypothetical protein ACT4QF_09880 [Sporichthyaceae bacterium]|jgi:hypothetical protein
MTDRPNGNGAEQALNVLRDIWSAEQASGADLPEPQPTGRVCKNTAMLGIKGMDDEGMAAAMREEWRRQLENEGKLPAGTKSIGQSVADGEL